MQCIQAVLAATALLLSVSTGSSQLADNIPTRAFLLMVATPDTSAVVSAVDQTLEEVNLAFPFQLKYNISDNQVSDINYRVLPTITTRDIYFVQCNGTKAIQSFYDAVTADSSVVAVVGCGCSSATEEVAKISHLWNVFVVSQL